MVAGQRIKIKTTELDDSYGQYVHDRRTIYLNINLPEKEILPTSFHIAGISFCENFEEEACVRCIDEVFFPAYERILKRLK
jgi:hypothetical protein